MSHDIVSFIYIYVFMSHTYILYKSIANIFTGIFNEIIMIKYPVNNYLRSIIKRVYILFSKVFWVGLFLEVGFCKAELQFSSHMWLNELMKQTQGH